MGLAYSRVYRRNAPQSGDGSSGWGFLKIARLPTHNVLHISAPHWLLVVVISFIAAAPWMGRRFSVRTLLIGMGVVAPEVGLLSALSR